MSNITHISKWKPRNGCGNNDRRNYKPKYNIHKRTTTTAYNDIQPEDVKTVCDKSNRVGYNNREFQPKTIGYGKMTNAGLFRNSKESHVVSNEFPSAVRRIVMDEAAGIVAHDPDDYVKPNYEHLMNRRNEQDEVWRDRGQHYRNDCSDSREHNPYYQFQNRQPNNHYNDRWNNEYRQQHRDERDRYAKNYHNDRNYGTHNNDFRNKRKHEDYRYERNEQHERAYVHRTRVDNSDSYRQNSRFYSNERNTPQQKFPNTFSKGYRPLTTMGRQTIESPFNSTALNSPLRRSYDDTSHAPSNIFSSLSVCGTPVVSSMNEESETVLDLYNFPYKVIAQRITNSAPRLPLSDDGNNRYGSTARNLLAGSFKQNDGRCSITMHDLLNRTTVINYTTQTQEQRHGDVENENLFPENQQADVYGLSPFTTPDREKDFNKTLAEEFHQDENYPQDLYDGIEVEKVPQFNVSANMSVDYNAFPWNNSQSVNENLINSPGDEQFFLDIENAVPQDLSDYNISCLEGLF